MAILKEELPVMTHLRLFLLACRAELSQKTFKGYDYIVGRFVRFCMESDIIDTGEVKAENVRMFYIRIRDTNNATSIRTYHRHIKRYFNWLVMEGFIDKNPLITVRPPTHEKKHITTLTDDDVRALLKVHSGNNGIDIRNRAIVLLLLDTGIRRSELVAMKREDITGNIIKIYGKGAKERIVGVGARTRQALDVYLELLTKKKPEVWVAGEYGPLETSRTPLTAEGLRTIIRYLFRRAGITGKKVGPHVFRHTFAMNFLRNGGDIFSLQAILGHEKLETVKIYLNMWEAEQALEVHRKVNPVDNMNI